MTQKWFYDKTAIQHFIAQPLLSFVDALNILLNGHGAFDVYDFNAKLWRTAIYIKHWPRKQRIMLRYSCKESDAKSDIDYNKFDKFVTLKIFPTNAVQIDEEKFKTNERDLKDMSNVPLDNVKKWIKRDTLRQKVVIKNTN